MDRNGLEHNKNRILLYIDCCWKNKKLNCCCDSRSYVWYRTNRFNRLDFMNAPKLNPLKRDEQSLDALSSCTVTSKSKSTKVAIKNRFGETTGVG